MYYVMQNRNPIQANYQEWRNQPDVDRVIAMDQLPDGRTLLTIFWGVKDGSQDEAMFETLLLPEPKGSPPWQFQRSEAIERHQQEDWFRAIAWHQRRKAELSQNGVA